MRGLFSDKAKSLTKLARYEGCQFMSELWSFKAMVFFSVLSVSGKYIEQMEVVAYGYVNHNPRGYLATHYCNKKWA